MLNKLDKHTGLTEILGHFRDRNDAIAELPQNAVKVTEITPRKGLDFWEAGSVTYSLAEFTLQ